MAITLESLVTPAATVLAVLLTSALTYGRGNKEKLWELRRQGYGVILSELLAVERICDAGDEYISENVHRYFEEDVSTRHYEEIRSRMGKAEDRFSADFLIFSDAFIACWERFAAARSGGWYDIPPESHERFSNAVREWRPKLAAQARREMPFARRWRR